MFGLQKYLNKLYEIKWYFKKSDWSDLESLLFVEFQPKEDYYVITNVKYTYVDILLALEDMDFTLKKEKNEYKIMILKI